MSLRNLIRRFNGLALVEVDQEDIIHRGYDEIDQYRSFDPFISNRGGKYIMSIDIGVKHLGVVFSEVDASFNVVEVIWFKLIDITNFKKFHDSEDCKIHHTKTFSDYMDHLFYSLREMFRYADHILIERQPLQGYVVVEQMIFHQFRDKTILISPNSMHAFFGWRWDYLDEDERYERRKEYSNKHCRKILCKNEKESHFREYLVKEFDTLVDFKGEVRKHDIADAVCILSFWLHKQKIAKFESDKKKKFKRKVSELTGLEKDFFILDQFKFEK